MLESTGCVTFSNAAYGGWEVPVKGTFIHFDMPLQFLPRALRRSTTCPPRFGCSDLFAPIVGWDAAMQELCHAMAPMKGGRDSEPAKPREDWYDDTYNTDIATQPWVDDSPTEECEQNEENQDILSEASTKDSSGAMTPKGAGTPTESPSPQGWTSYSSPRKKQWAQTGRASDRRLSGSAAPRGGRSGRAAAAYEATAAAASRPSFKGKGLSYFERIEVGIEDDRDFRVVQRLIGPRGKHMQDIVMQCKGSKVWIIGRGSRSWEDSVGPLVVCVGATSRSTFDSAAGLVRELLEKVHEDYRRFSR